MRTLALLLVAAGIAGAAGAASAQTYRNEISVFGAWEDVDEPANVEVLSLHARYGRHVSPQLLATGSLSRTSFDGGGTDSTTTAVLVGAKYYFGQPGAQTLTPFAEAGIGFANTDTPGDSGTDLTWEAGGGAAIMITERTSIDASLRLYNTETDARTKGLRMFLGLTTRF